MKKGWEAKPLGDVCDFRGGGTPSKAVARYWSGDIPWVSPKDMKSDVITDSIDHITDEAISNSSASLIPTGAVLVVVRSGILNRTIPLGVAGRPLSINQDVKALCPSADLDPTFLLYFLRAKEATILGMVGRGATVHRLLADQLRQIPVPVPPLHEQRRIVAILDEAFEGIAAAKANAEKNLRNAREVFEAELEKMFSYEEAPSVSLEEVCAIDSSLVDPRERPHDEMLHVGGANMVTGTGGLIDLKTAKEEGLISGKFAFGEGVVLYSKIRPYLRKVARPDFCGLCSADVYPLTPKAERLDRNYLYYLLLSPQFTDYAVTGSARAGMPKVNRPYLFAYRFSLPALEKQRHVAKRLDAICESVGLATGSIETKTTALDELKASLLHQAFTGQL